MSFEDEPRPSPERRWATPVVARLRPWLDWFGAGRLVLSALAVVAVVGAGWWLLRSPAPPTEAGLPYASTTVPAEAAVSTAPVTAPPGVIVVHVAGAVARPGVYELAGDVRVHTAIDAAGGALADGVPGSLNLAAALTDGARVYVPVVGETVPPAAVVDAAGVPPPAGPVDLNRASPDELDELPGIGPATAQAIVDHRLSNGPFAAVDDLEAVRGIGPAKLETIRPLVTV